jgi:phage terminase small subunit
MTRVKLTARQERFAFNIASGFSQYESYLKAGYADNSDRAVVDKNACELIQNSKVVSRIKELQAPSETGKVLSLTERKEKLSDLFKRSVKDPVSVRDGLQAVDLLNKMEKIYSDAPTIIHNTQTVFIIGKGYGSRELLESPQSGILESTNQTDHTIVK